MPDTTAPAMPTYTACDTDLAWERWGQQDPYFGVLTAPRFRRANLTPQARLEFFDSGDRHVAYVLQTCRRHLDAGFQPARVLDHGCGVGRLAIPFARTAAEVVALDIAPSMLDEARRNALEFGMTNIQWALADDALGNAQGPFDLVHSYIVLQHLEVARARQIFASLIGRLRPGGIAAVQVAYAWDVYRDTHGQKPPAPPPPPPPQGLARWRAMLGTWREQLAGKPAGVREPAQARQVCADPDMLMNYLNLSELFFIAQQSGARQIITDLADHGGACGAFLFFRTGH